MIVDHTEYPPPEFGDPKWYNLRSQPNKKCRAAYIRLPVVAACGEEYPTETKDANTPLESNLIPGLDYLGEYCLMGGYARKGNPPVRCRPPEPEAGRKCALSVAISDSSFWKVPNTPGIVDYVLTNKCASFFKGGSMADHYNGATHHATLLR